MSERSRNFKLRFHLPWRSLSLQLFLIVVLPLTLLLLVIAFGSLQLHQKAMRNLVGERDKRAVRTAAKALESEINHRTSAIHSIALRAASNSQESPQQILSSSDYLLHDFDAGLAIFNHSGSLLASTGDRSYWPFLNPGSSAELAAALSQAVDTPFISKTFSYPATKQPLVFISSKVATRDWIVVGAFSPAELAQFTLTDAFPSGHLASVYLLDRDSQLLYQSGSLDLGSNPCQQAAIAGICRQQSGITYIKPGKDEYAVAYASVSPTGWGLVTVESWQMMADPSLQSTQLAPLVLVPALLIALAGLWLGARQVVQPLQKLESEAARLSWGNFQDIEIPVGGIAEVRQLQTELIHMAHKVQAAQQSLRGYIGSITAGQEEERRRLARDLHDDTIQGLIALKQRVQLAQMVLADPAAKGPLGEIESLAEQTIEDLRRLIRDLRPIYLEDLGLTAALETLANHTAKTTGLMIDFERQGEEKRLAPEVELALYRMVQEAISNVIRHAQASHASVRIRFTPQVVGLEVIDDGKGFLVPKSPAEFAPKGHYGLLGLNERAELIGARLEIESSPGQGTRLCVSIAAA